MILDIALIICAFVLAIYLLLNIAGSSLYSLSELKRSLSKNDHQNKYRKLPIVSVIVPVSSSGSDISACLKSLFASRYPSLDIIIIDSNPGSSIKKVVHKIMSDHPTKQIRFIHKPKMNSRVEALRYASRKARGEFILALSNCQVIKKDIIKKALLRLNERPDVGIMLANEIVSSNYTIAGLYGSLFSRFTNVSIKAQCFFKATYFIDHNHSAFYRTSLLKNTSSLDPFVTSKDLKVAYGSDLVTKSATTNLTGLIKKTLIRQLSLARALSTVKSAGLRKGGRKNQLWPVVQAASVFILALIYLCLPAVLGYFTYLAIALKEPDFLEISLILFGIYLIFAVSQDDQSSLADKIISILLSPVYISWLCLLSMLKYLTLTIVTIKALSESL
jgi:hypothetical protein